MSDELTEHRLNKLENAVFSIDESLKKLVAIEQSHNDLREAVKNIANRQETLSERQAAHSERLDSHRWALRTVFGAFAVAIVGGIWAAIT